MCPPSESPNNNWGANWSRGLTDPSCPGEEEEGCVLESLELCLRVSHGDGLAGVFSGGQACQARHTRGNMHLSRPERGREDSRPRTSRGRPSGQGACTHTPCKQARCMLSGVLRIFFESGVGERAAFRNLMLTFFFS